MPEKLILTDTSVVVDGVTLTQSARSVTINTSSDEIDVTTFGGSGWREFEPGLKQGQIDVEFYQGFDSGGVHQTIWPLHAADTAFDIIITPKGGSHSVTNPSFSASVKVYAYNFLQGAVGEASPNTVTFRLTGAPTILAT